jgi:SAM-dependent methyltransferase
MRRQLLKLLCCPKCQGDLELTATNESIDDVESGQLKCVLCAMSYPVQQHIPRFVEAENYARNFGIQWNLYRKTQLDSHAGQPISRERFFRSTGWRPEELSGKWVLDVGCGAGRFSEIVLSCGANVVSLDYSLAVEACYANLKHNENSYIIQGNIYEMPFRPGQFDFVYCLGVLQHTPDVKRAFMALPAHLREGGRLAVDVYTKQWLNILWPKYWIRPITKRLSSAMQFSLVKFLVTLFLPISIAVGRIPYLGRKLRYAFPVANYDGILSLTKSQHREWSLLDTFDMLAPMYDYPQSATTLTQWFTDCEFKNIEVFRSGHLVGRGTTKAK